MKTFDHITNTVIEREPLSAREAARRGIAAVQHRLANPDLRDDVRELQRAELRRLRGIFMRGGKP